MINTMIINGLMRANQFLLLLFHCFYIESRSVAELADSLLLGAARVRNLALRVVIKMRGAKAVLLSFWWWWWSIIWIIKPFALVRG